VGSSRVNPCIFPKSFRKKLSAPNLREDLPRVKFGSTGCGSITAIQSMLTSLCAVSQ
jgi:hypothetical protein